MAKGIIGLAKSDTKSVKQQEKNKKSPTKKNGDNSGVDVINARINESVDDILREIKASEIITKKTESIIVTDKINEKKVVNDIDTDVKYSDEYVEWLKEQVDILTNENQNLKNVLNQNGFYGGNVDDGDSLVKEKVLELFIELNEHYHKMRENFIINPPNFIMRLIKFFPFLEPYRRF